MGSTIWQQATNFLFTRISLIFTAISLVGAVTQKTASLTIVLVMEFISLKQMVIIEVHLQYYPSSLPYFIIVYCSMQDRTSRRHFQDLNDLSPWTNEQKVENSRTIEVDIVPKKIKRMKNIAPRIIKVSSERKSSEKNTIKVTDYELPPVNKRFYRDKQQYSLTIDPPQGKLLRNISSHRLQSSESMNYIVPEHIPNKFRLSGKKYDMIPPERSMKWQSVESKHNAYQNNNTVLLFSKKKDDILKRVLHQIQGRIKDLGIYE